MKGLVALMKNLQFYNERKYATFGILITIESSSSFKSHYMYFSIMMRVIIYLILLRVTFHEIIFFLLYKIQKR